MLFLVWFVDLLAVFSLTHILLSEISCDPASMVFAAIVFLPTSSLLLAALSFSLGEFSAVVVCAFSKLHQRCFEGFGYQHWRLCSLDLERICGRDVGMDDH